MDATDQPADREARPVSYWVTLAILAGGILLYIVLVTRPGPELPGDQGPGVGQRLGYLKLEPLTGDAQAVTAEDLDGRVTLINYWGTWCPPCIQEFPHIVDLAEKYGDQEDFRLYAVSCGSGGVENLDELTEKTEAFLKQRDATLPTYADEDASSRQAMIAQFKFQMAYPTTMILDRQGIVRGVWMGFDPRSINGMDTMIQKLLDESLPSDHAHPHRHPHPHEDVLPTATE